jgi:ectoine hydroxylase-related dioxygenase (phytanoyl-CoA dioxygenase family)
LLDVKEVKKTLIAKGGDVNGLIPPGTLMLFRGDLTHAGPSNLNNWPRSAIFMESRRTSMGSYVDDVQMHPIQAAMNKYTLDLNEDDFFRRLKECENLYGKYNAPSLTSLIPWPVVSDTTTLRKYKDYCKLNYTEYW